MQIDPETLERAQEAVLSDESLGFCLNCGAENEECEPDACKRQCSECGEYTVYGAEEIVLMGVY